MQSLIKTTLAAMTLGVVASGDACAGGADIEATVETLNKNWNQAFNSADAKALANLYAENAVLSPGNGQVLNGRAEIENLFKSFFEAGLHNHTLEIVTVGGDEKTLYQVARWGALAPEKDGVKPAYGGITTSVFEKDANGKWVARSHVWNAGN
ncbi:MAG TPA: SgcJ/EcaC family oxidoreductase [Methylophilaceae bacterium]|jgi:uncharacterized protein (TIGR02246 family)